MRRHPWVETVDQMVDFLDEVGMDVAWTVARDPLTVGVYGVRASATTDAEMVRAALTEAGRPDLATMVGTARDGGPIVPPLVLLGGGDASMIGKALETVDTERSDQPEGRRWVPHWSPAAGAWRRTYSDQEWAEHEDER